MVVITVIKQATMTTLIVLIVAHVEYEAETFHTMTCIYMLLFSY